MNDDNILSEVETLILMLLETKSARESKEVVIKCHSVPGWQIVNDDQGKLLKLPDMSPSSAFTTQLGTDGNERLFSRDFRDLLCHPVDILGDTAETVLLDNDTVKWTGFRRLKKMPSHVVCLGKADILYEHHYRQFTQGAKPVYQKRLAIFDKSGRPLPAKKYSHWVSYDNGIDTILHASVIEDAMRAGSMLATISDATELKFPVPLDSYKELFIIRDAPLTPAGRKKAILHWVAKHLRTSPKGKESQVKAHTRGVDTFYLAGIKVTLTPNVRRMAA